MMKRKKLILFIVEGPTDENALYPVMRSFFPDAIVKFHVAHGDLMLDADKSEDPLNLIRRIVAQERKRYGLKMSDILSVFEIIDTDGAFSGSSFVIYKEEANKAEYTEDAIYTAHRLSFLQRNKKKSRNANILSMARLLTDEIPYRLYYMSRNLEHALFNITESVSDNRKTNLSDHFSDEVRNHIAFISFLEKEGLVEKINYTQSWELINRNNESLKRHTNIYLLFEDFRYLS